MTPIKKMEAFATPDSVKTIESWINEHPPRDRLALWTIAGMTWNYLAEVVNEQIKEEDDGRRMS